ncbi:MAG: ATP-binding protein, partial [Candidatus Omnitrophica bacterium]|nr:ATP-binding protein [Candidatus Omnitrophota bacterium]
MNLLMPQGPPDAVVSCIQAIVFVIFAIFAALALGANLAQGKVEQEPVPENTEDDLSLPPALMSVEGGEITSRERKHINLILDDIISSRRGCFIDSDQEGSWASQLKVRKLTELFLMDDSPLQKQLRRTMGSKYSAEAPKIKSRLTELIQEARIVLVDPDALRTEDAQSRFIWQSPVQPYSHFCLGLVRYERNKGQYVVYLPMKPLRDIFEDRYTEFLSQIDIGATKIDQGQLVAAADKITKASRVLYYWLAPLLHAAYGKNAGFTRMRMADARYVREVLVPELRPYLNLPGLVETIRLLVHDILQPLNTINSWRQILSGFMETESAFKGETLSKFNVLKEDLTYIEHIASGVNDSRRTYRKEHPKSEQSEITVPEKRQHKFLLDGEKIIQETLALFEKIIKSSLVNTREFDKFANPDKVKAFVEAMGCHPAEVVYAACKKGLSFCYGDEMRAFDLREFIGNQFSTASAILKTSASTFSPEEVSVNINLCRRPQLIFASENIWERILSNVVVNIKEAFDRAGFSGKKEVDFCLMDKEEGTVLTITDSGPGFPESMLVEGEGARYVDFSKVASSKKLESGKEGGRGILSMRRLVEQMGGTMRIISDGRTFTQTIITVPLILDRMLK